MPSISISVRAIFKSFTPPFIILPLYGKISIGNSMNLHFNYLFFERTEQEETNYSHGRQRLFDGTG
jgi:hypothetical protein